nr:5532_t:CDS:2 [Entrophospora candida]
MYSKTIALIIQSYLYIKAGTKPHNLTSKPSEVIKKEGIIGFYTVYIFPYMIVSVAIFISTYYIFLMFGQQYKAELLHERDLSSWYLVDLIFYFTTVFGALLRLWCYRSLDEFFTFDLNVQKDHKLITTGPYSLLIHPSYTGYTLMLANIEYMSFVIKDYLPNYIEILIFNYVTVLVFFLIFFNRITVEEKILKKHFGRDWEVYCSQRKRFIPYLL